MSIFFVKTKDRDRICFLCPLKYELFSYLSTRQNATRIPKKRTLNAVNLSI